MADELGIDYPVISDPDNQLARKYVGIDDQGYPIPGTVLIAQDGAIVWRRSTASKSDRVFAAELFGVVDELAGVERDIEVRGGFLPAERWMVRFQLGGGVQRAEGETDGLGVLSVSAYAPVQSWLALGVGADLSTEELATLTLRPRLRTSIWSEVGSAYLETPVGLATSIADASELGFSAGARLGAQFAYGTRLGPAIEAGTTYVRLNGASALAIDLSLALVLYW